MKLVKTVKIQILSEAISPITHMMGISGNEAVLNREKVLHNGCVKNVPVLSGNALRHKMIREPGMMYLVKTCDLMGKLSIDQANYMFTGGSLTESSTTDNISVIADMKTVSPLFRLLGGSLKNQIIGGSLFVSRGVLICEETSNTLSEICPFDILPKTPLLPARHFVNKYQYTRGDVLKHNFATSLLEETPEEKKKSNLMIYSGENVIPGAMFYHDIILYNVSPLEVGAALHSIEEWEKSGGIIGGSARIGHGRVRSGYIIDGLKDWFDQDLNQKKLISDYEAHVMENATKLKAWLKKAFPTKADLLC